MRIPPLIFRVLWRDALFRSVFIYIHLFIYLCIGLPVVGPGPSARDLRSRPLYRCFLCKPFYKQTHTTYQNHFSFWLTHPINPVSKNTIVEKDTFLCQINDLKPFVYRPPPSARDHKAKPEGPVLFLCKTLQSGQII